MGRTESKVYETDTSFSTMKRKRPVDRSKEEVNSLGTIGS